MAKNGEKRRLQAAAAVRWPLLRRFWLREDGATAIEFGIVVMPFLALLFAVIETSIVFFAGQTLQTAIADSSRMIMTGQAKEKGFDQGKFKADVCSRLVAMIDCEKLAVSVQTYTNFSLAAGEMDVNDPKTLVDSDGKFKSFPYNQGCPGDIVVARAMYQWPITISLLGLNLADMADNKRLLLATAAFRNEPFGTTC